MFLYMRRKQNIFCYLSRKFVNIYHERAKLTAFSLIALICDSGPRGERKII